MSGRTPHPFCTKCNDQLRPKYREPNCPECLIHDQGPAKKRQSYKKVMAALDVIDKEEQPFVPPWDEARRFAYKQRTLRAIYEAGYTEREFEDMLMGRIQKREAKEKEC